MLRRQKTDLEMRAKPRSRIRNPKQKTITRSKLTRLTLCNSKRFSFGVNDGGVRKERVGIDWIEDGMPHRDEVLVIADLAG